MQLHWLTVPIVGLLVVIPQTAWGQDVPLDVLPPYIQEHDLDWIATHVEFNFAELIALPRGAAKDQFSRGIDLSNARQFRPALEAFDQSTKLNPEDANAWYGRGVVLGRLKRYGEAISSFDQSIRLRPGFRAAVNARRQAQICSQSGTC